MVPLILGAISTDVCIHWLANAIGIETWENASL